MKTILETITTKGIALSLLVASITAQGGETPTVDAVIIPNQSSWEFYIEPYGWLTGLEGTTGVGSFTSEVDSSFSDIIDNINMAAALKIEARHGRWGIIADGFYADLEGSGSTPGPFYNSVDIEMQQIIAELYIAYRIYESPKGFVDLYGGVRYNDLSLNFSGSLDRQGIQGVSDRASERIFSGVKDQAAAIVKPKVASYKAAAAARRSAIEAQLASAIEAKAEARIKSDLERQLVQIRRDGGLNARDIATNRISRAVKAQQLELARSTAQLEVARLRAAANAALQSRVKKAQARVDKAKNELATAINDQLLDRIPTQASADKQWLDPIIGARAQYNINEKWFLAGKADVGGFGVGSDITWTLQGTFGYNFTSNVSAELGYRYMKTDYQNGNFIYDVAEAGVYTGLSIRF